MKKIIKICLVLMFGFMSITMNVPQKIQASQTYTYNNFEYEEMTYESRLGYRIIKYNGNDKVVEIPSSINDKAIFAVKGFDNNETIEEVILPNSVVEVGGFSNCTNLKKINLSDVRTITDYAFYNCDSLTGIYMKNDLVSIGRYAFKDCDALYEVYLSTALQTIGNEVFAECDKLTYVYNMEFLKGIPKYFIAYSPNVKNVKLNANLIGIGDYAFVGNQHIEKIVFPETISYVGTGAFSGCENLKEIEGLENLNEINASVFAGCDSLETVTIPESITSIGNKAFISCENLKSVHILGNVSTISSGLFENCTSLVQITLPDSIETIGDNAFQGCKTLKEITLPANLKQIEHRGFGDCVNLEKINFNEGLEVISSYAFANTAIKNIVCPTTLTIIHSRAFKGTKKLNSIDFNHSDVEIVSGAFSDSALANINFSDGNVVLDGNCFGFLDNLKELTFTSNVNYLDSSNKGEFQECSNLETLIIEEGVTRITPAMFKDCFHLKTVKFPSTLKKINRDTFEGCISLEEIILPEGVEILEVGSFANCSNLKFVEIQNKNIQFNYESYYMNQSPFTLDTFKVVYPGTKEEWAELVKDTPWMIDNYVSYQEMIHLKLKDKKAVKVELLSDEVKATYEQAIQEIEYKIQNQPVTSLNEYQVIRDEINALDQLLLVDQNVLMKLIQTIKTKDYSAYYDLSVSRFMKAVTEFEAVCKMSNLTYNTVEQAYLKLKSVESNMTKKINFVDLDEKAWYIHVVYNIIDSKLMQATGKQDVNNPNAKYFEPDAPITRGMVATIIYRNEGSPVHKFENNFKDIKANIWYTQAVVWCNRNGIVSGYDVNSGNSVYKEFRADNHITRQDLAVILRNYANNNGVNTDKTSDLSKFKDYKEVDDYAKSAMAWCVEAGVLNGSVENGQMYLNPKAKATRAECAKMFVLIKQLIE